MKKRLFCMLLALVMLLSLAPVLAPQARAFDSYSVSGTIKLSSYKTGDTLILKGNTTLKVDASICLYGILSQMDSTPAPKYNLTIQGDGTHNLSIAGWEHECILVKNLEIKDTTLYCTNNLVQAHGTFKCSNAVCNITMDSASSSPLVFVKSTADLTSSVLNLTSKGKCYTCNSKTTLTSSTVFASAGSGATAIWTESIGGEKYTVKASGGAYGLMLYDQQYGPSPTLIDVTGTTAGIYCQRGNLSCAYTHILYPENGVCNGTTVTDSQGTTAKRAILGLTRTIAGDVTVTNTSPTYGSYLYPKLSGAVTSIPEEDRIVVWQRSSSAGTGFTDRPDQGIADHGYSCDATDVNKYLRVKVTAVGYTGALYSTAVKVSKSSYSASPTAPALNFTGSVLQVTNPKLGQEYFSSTTYYSSSTMQESYWKNAKTPSSESTPMTLGYVPGKVNYVYTRIAENEWHYASTVFASSSVDCTKTYQLWVTGTQVTENNCASLAGGAMTFIPASSTLVIKSSFSGSGNLIENRIPGLIIKTADTGAKLSCSSGNGIVAYANTTITGSGKLGLEAPLGCAVYVRGGAALTITDADLEVTNSNWGVCGPGQSASSGEKLTITNSTVKAGSKYGSVCDFYGGITLNQSYILFPQPSQFQNGNSAVSLSSGSNALNVEIHPQPFVDIKPSEYWFYPIMWAYEHEPRITSGTDATHFGPKKDCTRAQIVTFLWHANNDPAPSSLKNPFTDVKEGKYYFEPVMWAYHSSPRITGGTGATTFGVSKSCTREQVVTFLWKAAGAPEPQSTSCAFTDVDPNKYYYKAVLWAVENKITGGVGGGKFGVGKTCTRGQIVTFLYAAYGPQG